MTNTAGEEIYNTFKPCSCNSTGGCEKCRPNINTKNYYKTYIPTEFEQWVERQMAKLINKKCPICGCEENSKNGREVYCSNCGAVLIIN